MPPRRRRTSETSFFSDSDTEQEPIPENLDSDTSDSESNASDDSDIEFEETIEEVGDVVDMELVETIDVTADKNHEERFFMSDATLRNEISRLISGKHTAKSKTRALRHFLSLLRNEEMDASQVQLFTQRVLPLVDLHKRFLYDGMETNAEEGVIAQSLQRDILTPFENITHPKKKISEEAYVRFMQDLLQPYAVPVLFEQLAKVQQDTIQQVVRASSVLDPTACIVFTDDRVQSCTHPDCIRLLPGELYSVQGFVVLNPEMNTEMNTDVSVIEKPILFDTLAYVRQLQQLRPGDLVETYFHKPVQGAPYKKDCPIARVKEVNHATITLMCRRKKEDHDAEFTIDLKRLHEAPAFIYHPKLWKDNDRYHKDQFFTKRVVAWVGLLPEDDAYGQNTRRLMTPTLGEALFLNRSTLRKTSSAAFGLSALLNALAVKDTRFLTYAFAESATLDPFAMEQWQSLVSKAGALIPAKTPAVRWKQRFLEWQEQSRSQTPRLLPSFLKFQDSKMDTIVRKSPYPFAASAFDSDLARFLYVATHTDSDLLWLAILLRKIKALKIAETDAEFTSSSTQPSTHSKKTKRTSRSTGGARSDDAAEGSSGVTKEDAVQEYPSMESFAQALRRSPQAFKKGDRVRVQAYGGNLYKHIVLKKTDARTVGALSGWEVVEDDLTQALHAWAGHLLRRSEVDTADIRKAIVEALQQVQEHPKELMRQMRAEMIDIRNARTAEHAFSMLQTKAKRPPRTLLDSIAIQNAHFLGILDEDEDALEHRIVDGGDGGANQPPPLKLVQVDPESDPATLQYRVHNATAPDENEGQDFMAGNIIYHIVMHGSRILLSNNDLYFLRDHLELYEEDLRRAPKTRKAIAEHGMDIVMSSIIYHTTAMIILVIQAALPERLVLPDCKRIVEYRTDRLLEKFEGILRMLPFPWLDDDREAAGNRIGTALSNAYKNASRRHPRLARTIGETLEDPSASRRHALLNKYGLFHTWSTYIPNISHMLDMNRTYTQKIVHGLVHAPHYHQNRNQKTASTSVSVSVKKPRNIAIFEQSLIGSRLHHEGWRSATVYNEKEPIAKMDTIEQEAKLETERETDTGDVNTLEKEVYEKLHSEDAPLRILDALAKKTWTRLSTFNQTQLQEWIQFIERVDTFSPMGSTGLAYIRDWMQQRFIQYKREYTSTSTSMPASTMLQEKEVADDADFMLHFMKTTSRVWIERLLSLYKVNTFSIAHKKYYPALIRQRIRELQLSSTESELLEKWAEMEMDPIIQERLHEIKIIYLGHLESLPETMMRLDATPYERSTLYTSLFVAFLQQLYHIGLSASMDRLPYDRENDLRNIDGMAYRDRCMPSHVIQLDATHPVHRFFCKLVVSLLEAFKTMHAQRSPDWNSLVMAFETLREQRKQGRIKFMDALNEDDKNMIMNALKAKVLKWDGDKAIQNSVLSSVAKASERKKKLQERLLEGPLGEGDGTGGREEKEDDDLDLEEMVDLDPDQDLDMDMDQAYHNYNPDEDDPDAREDFEMADEDDY